MNSLRDPSGNPKSVAIVVLLAVLVLITGLNATKSLLCPCKSNESSPWPNNVNASSVEPTLEVNYNSSGVNHGTPVVSAEKSGVTSGNPNATVWVNTTSGVYHCSNSRWYGNTKSGQHMTQKEAQSKGYRPAHGSACG